jgi:hypothetical protein
MGGDRRHPGSPNRSLRHDVPPLVPPKRTFAAAWRAAPLQRVVRAKTSARVVHSAVDGEVATC